MLFNTKCDRAFLNMHRARSKKIPRSSIQSPERSKNYFHLWRFSHMNKKNPSALRGISYKYGIEKNNVESNGQKLIKNTSFCPFIAQFFPKKLILRCQYQIKYSYHIWFARKFVFGDFSYSNLNGWTIWRVDDTFLHFVQPTKAIFQPDRKEHSAM